MLSRGSSGVEVVRIHRDAQKGLATGEDAKLRTSSGDLDGAGESENEIEEKDTFLQRELSSHEVRDWAAKVGGGGGGESSNAAAPSGGEEKQEQHWDWRHLGSG